MNKYGNSSFWLNPGLSNEFDILTGEKINQGKNLVKLAASKRAIGNFVNIVTGENIPVTFTGKDSYTDGKTVTIGADLKDSNFDAAVGLALHEGSHIKLTDFKTLPAIEKAIKDRFGYEDGKLMDARATIKDLVNIIEDRRIDYFIFKTSPGYKGYYHAMYDKYFNAKIIDKALILGENSEENWDNYLFHICNFINPNRNLTALPKLQEVWDLINIKDISRLETTWDSLALALDVYELVNESLPEPEECDGNGKGKDDGECDGQTAGNTNPVDGNGSCGDGPSGGKDDGSTADGSTTMGQTEVGNGGPGGNTPITSQLSDRQQQQLKKAIEAQEKFLDGSVKKTKLSKSALKSVEAIADSAVEETNVGAGEFTGRYGKTTHNGVKCILVKKLTKKLIDSESFKEILTRGYGWTPLDRTQEDVDKGLRLGSILGRKLQIRNESRTLKTTRLPKGRIDKRLLSSLGYGAENIFSTMDVQKHKNAIVHLSIDASGSMSGTRFSKSMTAAVAIAKAASMTNNFDVQISFRSTEAHQPLALIAYDSRTDKILKIQTLFKHIYPGGTTPEGLCFEALQDHLSSSAGNLDSYFINFSDGQPWFNGKGMSYGGEYAIDHTRKQVNKMTNKGIKVLSYFIDGGDYGLANFQKMYGKGASNISVDELMPLARSLNKMFI
jgi:hypothetical protein